MEKRVWKGNYGRALSALRSTLSSPKFCMDDVHSPRTQGAVILTEDKWFTKLSSIGMQIGSKRTPVCLHSLCSFRGDVMGYITEGTKRMDAVPPPPPSKGGFKIVTDGLALAGFKWECLLLGFQDIYFSPRERPRPLLPLEIEASRYNGWIWMDLETVMLSEVSQRRRNMTSLMCGI